MRVDDDGKAYLRNSERKSYKKCRWQWYINYVSGRQAKTKSVPLVFGSLVHDCLEGWYKPGRERGVPPVETFKKMFAEREDELRLMGSWSEEGEFDKIYDLGVAMLEGYVRHYGTEPHIEIIQPEQPFQLDVYHPDTGEYVVTAVGTMDALMFDHNIQKFGLLEHKTWKRVQTKHLQIDEQASTYWALVPLWLREQGFFKPDEDIHFMLYNVLKKTKPDTRPQNEHGQYLNQDGTVSKRQPEPPYHRSFIYRDVHDRDALIRRLCQEAMEIKMVQEGRLPVYKNPTNFCPFMCNFFDACELDECGGDAETYLEMTTEPYDPYDAHHEKTMLMLERGNE